MQQRGQHWREGEEMADEYGITALTDPADIPEIEVAYEKAYQSAVARGYTGLYENLAPWEETLGPGPSGVVPAVWARDWWRKGEEEIPVSVPSGTEPTSSGAEPTSSGAEPAPSYQNIFILAVAALVIYALVK